jgi:hypothetical protein
LERLCRYVARPTIAPERLSRDGDGLVVYELKHPFRDGATHEHVNAAQGKFLKGRKQCNLLLRGPLEWRKLAHGRSDI